MDFSSSSPPQKRLKLQTSSSSLPPPIAVLDDEYYADVQQVDVYVATVADKARISHLMQRLKTEFPMPENLAHLKRVKGYAILLTLVEGRDREACMDMVRTVRDLLPVIEVRSVPAKLPKTKQQHVRANALWPCNFHPSKQIESLLASTFFTPDQVLEQYEFMRLALQTAEEKRALVGAVVVSARSGKVVATAHDERSRNPSSHAVMMVLENVATVQRESRTAAPSEGANVQVDQLPYLCTGYDLSLIHI